MGSKTWPITHQCQNLFKSTFRGYNKNDWTLKLIYLFWILRGKKINCLLQKKQRRSNKNKYAPLILCHQCLIPKKINGFWKRNMPGKKLEYLGGFSKIWAFKIDNTYMPNMYILNYLGRKITTLFKNHLSTSSTIFALKLEVQSPLDLQSVTSPL